MGNFYFVFHLVLNGINLLDRIYTKAPKVFVSYSLNEEISYNRFVCSSIIILLTNIHDMPGSYEKMSQTKEISRLFLLYTRIFLNLYKCLLWIHDTKEIPVLSRNYSRDFVVFQEKKIYF